MSDTESNPPDIYEDDDELDDEVGDAINFGPEFDQVYWFRLDSLKDKVRYFNKYHCFLMQTNDYAILEYDEDCQTVVAFQPMNKDQFKNSYAPLRVRINGRMKPFVIIWDTNKARSRYKGIMYGKSKPGCLYVLPKLGFQRTDDPIDYDAFEIIIRHLREIICSGDEEVFEFILNG